MGSQISRWAGGGRAVGTNKEGRHGMSSRQQARKRRWKKQDLHPSIRKNTTTRHEFAFRQPRRRLHTVLARSSQPKSSPPIPHFPQLPQAHPPRSLAEVIRDKDNPAQDAGLSPPHPIPPTNPSPGTGVALACCTSTTHGKTDASQGLPAKGVAERGTTVGMKSPSILFGLQVCLYVNSAGFKPRVSRLERETAQTAAGAPASQPTAVWSWPSVGEGDKPSRETRPDDDSNPSARS